MLLWPPPLPQRPKRNKSSLLPYFYHPSTLLPHSARSPPLTNSVAEDGKAGPQNVLKVALSHLSRLCCISPHHSPRLHIHQLTTNSARHLTKTPASNLNADEQVLILWLSASLSPPSPPRAPPSQVVDVLTSSLLL